MSFKRVLTFVSVAGLALAACATPAGTTAPTTTPTLAPTASPSAAPSASPSATASATASLAASPSSSASASPAALCPKDELVLKNPGRLTLSTDNPSFPPWWGGDPKVQYPGEPEGGSGWELSDPYSQEGFEGATAYAIADVMGFEVDEVDWVPNVVFENAFAPGAKPFDFHMAQLAITPERAEAVDFTDPYFELNQSLIALSSNPITNVTSVADLKGYTLGAAANTTSFDLIEDFIQPTAEPRNYPSNDLAVEALKAGGEGGLDGLIVDIGTAFYMRDAQIENYDTPDPEAKIVGQFGPPAVADKVGAVLEKGSPLTACVNAAIASLWLDGSQQARIDEWIATGQDIPFFE